MADQKTEQQKAADKKMADDKAMLAKQNAERQKQQAEHQKNKGRPTPTQEELDLLMLGNHPELSPDGSPQDPNVTYTHKTSEAEHHSGGGYQTRQSQPQARQPQHHSS